MSRRYRQQPPPSRFCLCHRKALVSCYECAAVGRSAPNRQGEFCPDCGARLVQTDDDKAYCRTCEVEVR